ncbi:unnamed protein product [Adineta ricciae]|uniref:Uncharacterized protein n=1 Tax=Adineta ricciae TaxID=249248 RepID=A0A815TM37_ADIRI|nr:unnamed protein product [Adineta ricciae]
MNWTCEQVVTWCKSFMNDDGIISLFEACEATVILVFFNLGFSVKARYKIANRSESKFRITCDLSLSCGISYNTYAGYKSHIYRHHFDQLRVSNNKSDASEPSFVNYISPCDANNDDDIDHPVDETDDFISTNEDEDRIDPINLFDSISDQNIDSISILDIKKTFALFMLQLREEFLLPKNVISSISTYIVTLVNSLHSLFEQKVMLSHSDGIGNILSSKSTSNSTTAYLDIDTIKNTINEVCCAVETVTRNEYQFQQFCEEYFSYRSPKQIILSNPGEATEVAYFIPFDETIKSILHNNYVVDQIFDNMKQQREKVFADDDLMFSFRDGEYGSRIDDDSLLVQLYIDDIGITNPIGAKKDMHKMSMIYFTLEDVPDQHRSQLEHIHLVGICTIADNLAAHQIGGFQSSFSTGYVCRRCFMKHCDLHLPMTQIRPDTRTSAYHDDLVKRITSNLNQTSIMGVVGKSPLYDLDGFHPTMSLPADLMHDYLEGVCPRVIISLLKEASALKLIAYFRIQERMEQFVYGHFDSRDKPPPILVKHLQNDKIAASASQKWCLFRLFPLIFADIVDKLPSFIVYKQLREIVDLVFSVPFRKIWLPTLRDLSFAFQYSMIKHFPRQVVPKVHFCTEYDQVINDYGPAIKQWSMRYESYHYYFKKVALRSNNYKNTPKMLATRYRLKQAFSSFRMTQLNHSDQAIRIQKVKNNLFSNEMKYAIINHFGNIDLSKDLVQCQKFRHENVEYCRFGIYIISLMNFTEAPEFVQVMNVIKLTHKWWLLVDVLTTAGYDDKLCAWEIKSMDKFRILDPNSMKYYLKGLDVYEIDNSTFVTFTARLTSY